MANRLNCEVDKYYNKEEKKREIDKSTQTIGLLSINQIEKQNNISKTQKLKDSSSKLRLEVVHSLIISPKRFG
jgi:hypothetical protein